MTQNGGSVQHKRGHNTIVTGLAMLVFGTVVAFIASGSSNDGAAGFTGFCVLVAVAGLITLLIGVGRRRETPVD